MPYYYWHGISVEGKKNTGLLQAASLEKLELALRNQNIALLHASIKNQPSLLPLATRAHFCNTLATLLQHGITIAQALTFITTNQKNNTLKTITTSILSDIQQGLSIAESLKKTPALFSEQQINLIIAGERSGSIAQVFLLLSRYFEEQLHYKKIIHNACIVPIVTITTAFSIVICLLIFIVPRFATLFILLNKTIPQSTQFLIAVSNFITSPLGYTSLLSVMICLYTAIRYNRSIIIKLINNSIGNHINFFILHDLMHYLQALSLNLAAGITLSSSLEHAIETIKIKNFKKSLAQAHHAVIAGKTLHAALNNACSKFIKPEIIALLALGEQVGKLPLFLEKSLLLTQNEYKQQLQVFTNLIQPLLIIITGVLVTGLLLMLYIPILNFTQPL